MILFLVNPGRQSRHYMVGLVRAAERMRLPHLALDLGDVWNRLAAAPDTRAAMQAVHVELARLVRAHRVTHAIGYAYNGTFDLGLRSRPGGVGQALFPHLGVRHVLLWTDHPEWATDGIAIRPPLVDVLRDPLMTHFVKSETAASEAAAVLRWPNITWMPMAEDCEAMRPTDGEAVHDVVAIVGEARALPAAVERFLSEDDPDPTTIDDLMREEAIARFTAAGGSRPLAEAWLDAKRTDPTGSFWRHAATLSQGHAQELKSLRGNADRWYAAVGTLRTMVAWRRNFWLAWLARRCSVGVYGSDASSLGIRQEPGMAEWVAYERQAEVYGRGRIAINTNAAHDEEGLTHKPFQIAAAGIAMVHHRSRGLGDCFGPGEVVEFATGRELLNAVKRLVTDDRARDEMADAARARAKQDHAWESRLGRMIGADVAAHSSV